MNTWKTSKEFHSKKNRQKSVSYFELRNIQHSIHNYRDRMFTLKMFESFSFYFVAAKRQLPVPTTKRAKNILLIISILEIKADQDWSDKEIARNGRDNEPVDWCKCGLISHHMKSNKLLCCICS